MLFEVQLNVNAQSVSKSTRHRCDDLQNFIRSVTFSKDEPGRSFASVQVVPFLIGARPRSTRLMDDIYTPDYQQLVPLKDHILERAPHFLAPEAVDK